MKERILSATIIAVGLIISGFLFGGRYSIIRDTDLVVWRLDRYTGSISMCGGVEEKGEILGCTQLGEQTGRREQISN